MQNYCSKNTGVKQCNKNNNNFMFKALVLRPVFKVDWCRRARSLVRAQIIGLL